MSCNTIKFFQHWAFIIYSKGITECINNLFPYNYEIKDIIQHKASHCISEVFPALTCCTLRSIFYFYDNNVILLVVLWHIVLSGFLCSKGLMASYFEGSKMIPFWSWLQMGKDLLLISLRYVVGAWKIEPMKLKSQWIILSHFNIMASLVLFKNIFYRSQCILVC